MFGIFEHRADTCFDAIGPEVRIGRIKTKGLQKFHDIFRITGAQKVQVQRFEPVSQSLSFRFKERNGLLDLAGVF